MEKLKQAKEIDVAVKYGVGVKLEIGGMVFDLSPTRLSVDDLSAADLDEIEACGMLDITPVDAAPAVDEAATGKSDKPVGDVLTTEIAAAIAALDQDDKSVWTKSGNPRIAALEAFLNYDISTAELNAALK